VVKIAYNYWYGYFSVYDEYEEAYYFSNNIYNNKRKRGEEDEERETSGSQAEWQSSEYQGPGQFNQYKMWEYKGYPGTHPKFGYYDNYGYGYEYNYNGAYAHEILTSFFSQNNLSPVWMFANQTWGWQDEETGLWNGAVGQVGYSLVLLL
jgi:hypothetical protein